MTNAGTLLDQTNSAERRAGELAAEVERLRERNLALAAALDRDKTGLANALDRCRKSAASRLWVTDGRGPYEWDDGFSFTGPPLKAWRRRMRREDTAKLPFAVVEVRA